MSSRQLVGPLSVWQLTVTCLIFASLNPNRDRHKSRIPFFLGSTLGYLVIVVPGGGASTSSLPSVFFSSALGAAFFFFSSALGPASFFLSRLSGPRRLSWFRLSWPRLAGRADRLCFRLGGVSSFFALRPGIVKSRLGWPMKRAVRAGVRSNRMLSTSSRGIMTLGFCERAIADQRRPRRAGP